MSFVSKDAKRLKSPEQCAAELSEVARELGLEDFAVVLALMCVAQESDFWCPWNRADPSSENYPHDSESNDGRSVAYFQQQNGAPGEVVTGRNNWWGPMGQRMDLKASGREFLRRLTDDYMEAANNPALASEFIANVQRCREDLRGAYAKHWGRARQLVQGVKQNGGNVTVPKTPTATGDHPDYNEFPVWSLNNSDRNGTTVDAFLMHTQEGGGGDDAALNLATWFKNDNSVSYHYTVSQASDGGVTVVDCVDTDRMAWSVLSANARSINLCFAGSRAAWSRDEWMKQSKAIDTAAYIAVQDCRKYNIAIHVVAPPYTGRIPGISDHRYVTKVLGDGTHTDVGDNFPWDYFIDRVTHWAVGSDVPPKPTSKRFPQDWTDRDLLVEILRQQRGATLEGWPQMGGRTAVDYLVHLGQKIDAIAAVVEKLKLT